MHSRSGELPYCYSLGLGGIRSSCHLSMLTSVETCSMPSNPWSFSPCRTPGVILFSHPQESFRSGFYQLIIWSPFPVQRTHSFNTRLWYREFLWGSPSPVCLDTQQSHFFLGVLPLPGILPWKEAQVSSAFPFHKHFRIHLIPSVSGPQPHTRSVKDIFQVPTNVDYTTFPSNISSFYLKTLF